MKKSMEIKTDFFNKTKLNRKIIAKLCLIAWFLFPFDFCLGNTNLEILEVKSDGNETDNEFLKIYNVGETDIDLKEIPLNLHIIDPNLNEEDKDKYKILNYTNGSLLTSKKYAILTANEKNCLLENLCIKYSTSGNTLKNGCTVYISKSRTDNKDILDIFEIEDETGEKLPKEYSNKIIINEIIPNPSDKEEYIELYNQGEDEDLSGWWLEDRAKRKCLLTGKILKNEFLILKNCGISLNNTQGENLKLFNPEKKEIFSLSYEGSAKINLSYSFDGVKWRWSQFLTPGKENKFNNLPEISSKSEKIVYVGIRNKFFASGKDKDNDKLKFTWDFGDNHRSYLRETSHVYEKAGKYQIKLTVSDGHEKKEKNFWIKVEKFPKTKIKIIALSPNPKGKDSENEWVEIKNESKKKINLNGWSIATGGEKIYSHPITKKLVIGPGKILRITRKYSKFTLSNKKSIVELRYPDGKVAHRVKYKKDGESVEEEEIYSEIDAEWVWSEKKEIAVISKEAKKAKGNSYKNNIFGSEGLKDDMNIDIKPNSNNWKISLINSKYKLPNEFFSGTVAGASTQGNKKIEIIVRTKEKSLLEKINENLNQWVSRLLFR